MKEEEKQIDIVVKALESYGIIDLKPEDRLLIWLFEQNAIGPEHAIGVPKGQEAPMYSLWIEDMIGHVGDFVYITPKGLIIVKALKKYFEVE